MHKDDTIDEETGNAKKPEIIFFYNCTKGAVDVAVEIAANCSTTRKTKRWPLFIFYFILNVAVINARIVFICKKNPAVVHRYRRRFFKDLAFSLIRDYANKQMDNSKLAHELRAESEKKNGCNAFEELPKKKPKTVSKVGVSFVPENRT